MPVPALVGTPPIVKFLSLTVGVAPRAVVAGYFPGTTIFNVFILPVAGVVGVAGVVTSILSTLKIALKRFGSGIGGVPDVL